ncbi:MAG TPA: 2-oxoglutarate dehydrogenase complex dihydrolipoyllysine-residue succinyltransferase [Rubrobacteraceae bacterium]|nr:2-oxoglutarate dehydrogenase complex dihydrolipoyllysine-residue succinyltransferase [Rubrobacteraceae bacterium]
MPDIYVPELGESVTEATVGQWLKGEGDQVKAGDPLVELETDKINFEVEAEQDGVLESIDKGEGEEVGVGDVIGTIGEGEGAAPQDDAGSEGAEEEQAEQEQAQAQEDEPPEPAPEGRPDPADQTNGHREDGDYRASPSVKKLAQEYDINLAEVSGSGSGGRITKDDVERLIRQQSSGGGQQEAPAKESPEQRLASNGDGQRQAAPAAQQNGREALEERVPLSRRRKTIASRLVEAQQTAAMLTTFNEADMSAVMELRKRRKDEFQERHEGTKLGFMSFFTKASIGALKAFPKINSELQENELILKHYYDIGVAVNTEQGLVVPVVRDADRKSFAEIEGTIAELGKKARDGKLGLEDLQGGTFTITNGGIFGSLNSTPILNIPQVAILGLHKIQERPVAVDGEITVRPMMYLALSYDHRIVDGADAVQFLVRIKDLIEDPESLLLEG